jgi:hypothetical protein
MHTQQLQAPLLPMVYLNKKEEIRPWEQLCLALVFRGQD